MKVYIASPSNFCSFKNLLFFGHWNIHLFESNQCFEVIELRSARKPTRSRKALLVHLVHQSSLSFSMHGFCHAEILIPIFHSLCKECLRLWPHLVYTHEKKETFAFSGSSETKTFPGRNVQREVGLCQTLANFGRSKSNLQPCWPYWLYKHSF